MSVMQTKTRALPPATLLSTAIHNLCRLGLCCSHCPHAHGKVRAHLTLERAVTLFCHGAGGMAYVCTYLPRRREL